MKTKLLSFAIIPVVILLWTLYPAVTRVQAAAPGRHDHEGDRHSEMQARDQETIRKSFSIGTAHKLLDVDNIWGSIEIIGGQSAQVQLVVNKTIYADSAGDLEAAKKEVTLDITDEPDLLRFYVNGPFRCNCNCDGEGCCKHSERHYVVKMDFQLQVPRNIDLKLKTVNDAHVNVRDVIGSFSVRNVNGGIEMTDVGGGKALARTVNGGVKVVFRENPKESSDFGTINGPVELTFARGLSADFRFKTMNGHVYTDFQMSPLPVEAATTERRGNKLVFRTDRFTGGRVGSGGLEIKADNLNGDIRVLERQ